MYNYFIKQCVDNPTEDNLQKLREEEDRVKRIIFSYIEEAKTAIDHEELLKTRDKIEQEQQILQQVIEGKVKVATILNNL